MTGGAKRGILNPWLFEESEETRGLGFDEIRQQQQKIIQGTEYPRSVGSKILSDFYYNIEYFLYPLKIRGRTIGLIKPLAMLCLRIPEA